MVQNLIKLSRSSRRYVYRRELILRILSFPLPRQLLRHNLHPLNRRHLLKSPIRHHYHLIPPHRLDHFRLNTLKIITNFTGMGVQLEHERGGIVDGEGVTEVVELGVELGVLGVLGILVGF